jgi:hypothetical protein
MNLTRRQFAAGALALVLPVHHRPNHRGKKPPPPSTLIPSGPVYFSGVPGYVQPGAFWPGGGA